METVSSTVCSHIKPKSIKNSLDLEILLASHDWKLEKAEENGASGILVTTKCKKCGADRVIVFSPQEPGPPAY